MTLTAESPLPRRLAAWAAERFPLANALLFLLLYAAALFLGQLLTVGPEAPLHLDARDVAGFIAVWSFFLLLRIFDEHKDFDKDSANHPDRVLQRGLITLGHLRMVGVASVALMAAVSVWYDGGLGRVTATWLAVMVWSGLMAREFFVGAWLEQRLVLYATSHMLVMPLAAWWMAQMGAAGRPLPATVSYFAALAFASGAAFEVTRKLYAPADERPEIDSYSKILGLRWGTLTVIAFLAAGLAVEGGLLRELHGGELRWGWFAALAAGFAVPFVSLNAFAAAPSSSGQKRNEGMVAVSMLIGYGVLIAAMIAERGVTWVAPS